MHVPRTYLQNTKRPVKNGSSLQSNSTDFQRTTKHSPFGPRSRLDCVFRCFFKLVVCK